MSWFRDWDFMPRAGRVDDVKGVAEKRRFGRRVRFGAVLMLLFSMAPVAQTRADRVSCADVVHELDAVTGRRGKHRADPVRVAHRLGVEPSWVMHCAQLYGRRLAQKLPAMSDEEREDMQERWESEETVEVEREDAVQGPLEVLEKRRDLRSTPTPNIEEERHMLEGENPPQ